MRNLAYLWLIIVCAGILACSNNEESERFSMLTTPVWAADSLLANGTDAGGPGGILEKFKGDAKFYKDGTGYFGSYTGDWRFNQDETEITIVTDSLALPIICDIALLTYQSLKITTVVPNPLNPLESIDIRMTFNAR